MKKDAEAHSDEDKKKREEVDVKNQADSLVYQIEQLLKDNKEKIKEETSTKLQAGADELKKIIETGEIDKIKAETEKLQQEVYAASSELYKAETPPEGAPSTEEKEGESSDETVADADYSEVDDKKDEAKEDEKEAEKASES